MNQKTHIFLDCDGVLADFDALASTIFGMPPGEYEAQNGAKAFWREIRHYRQPETDNGFFRSLPLMPDAMDLFNAVRHLNPTILTGCPFGDWAPQQKLDWAAEKFPGTKMITCMARSKIEHLEQPGDILVDDKTKYQAIWEEGGGVFVLHTDAKSSIEKLRALRPEWFSAAAAA
jgi:5'(3')-deoxyribonucleotidase